MRVSKKTRKGNSPKPVSHKLFPTVDLIAFGLRADLIWQAERFLAEICAIRDEIWQTLEARKLGEDNTPHFILQPDGSYLSERSALNAFEYLISDAQSEFSQVFVSYRSYVRDWRTVTPEAVWYACDIFKWTRKLLIIHWRDTPWAEPRADMILADLATQ
jgi:hypothetical protein